MKYQVGSFGAGGEWHFAPSTEGEIFATYEEANAVRERAYEIASVALDERTDLIVREVKS